MKRKGSMQPILIVVTILLIGVIAFSLFKFGAFKNNTVKDENPPVGHIAEKDKEKDEDIADEELTDNVELEEEDFDIEVGKLAPDFTLKNLKGEEVSLSDYRGKIVFINFWATWCGFCDKEMPDFHRLAEENEDLVILAVNVREKKKIVENYIEDGGYDFEVVLDEDGKVSMDYLINPLPTTYFIDTEGILLGRFEGMLTWPQMNNILETIREIE